MICKRPYPQRKCNILRRCFAATILTIIASATLAYGYYHAVVAAEVPVLEAVRGTPVVPGHDITLAEFAALRAGKASAATAPVQTSDTTATAPAPQREPSPWFGSQEGAPIPFAGQSIKNVAASLAKQYQGRKPTAWGEHMQGVTDTLWKTPAAPGFPTVIALTFDACGGKKGSGYDAELIDFLRANSIKATLFITSTWAKANPKILKELAADPLFEIAGHGSKHRPSSVNGNSVYGIKGTASFFELTSEVEGNMRDLAKATGVRPRWFRSGTAYYDDVAVSAIHTLGLGIGGYSIAGDEGATLPAEAVATKTLAAKDGDILLFHMNRPQSGTRDGLKKALPVLMERGISFVRLSDIIK